MMNRAVIALGSNIAPKENIEAALRAIAEAFLLVEKSRFVYTRPVSYTNQPDFLNGSVLIESPSEEPEIISILKSIEQKLGRKRNGPKNGPRKIDLDLVLYNGQIIDDDVHERDFLKRSIEELLPDLKLAP